VHDPAKVVLDLAVTLALGGDCLADIALLRSSPGVFGLVASVTDGHERVTAAPWSYAGSRRRTGWQQNGGGM
jgi:hypothetical protein